MSVRKGRLPQNIILIGFMAAGKSSVGRLLAKELGWRFLDTDSEIERITGLEIPDIFKNYGEARFRSEEKAAVKRLSGLMNTVIATGGGTVLNPENWQLLQQMGLTVYLYAPLAIALQRAKNQKNERPMITNNSPEEIEKLWQVREKIYQRAELVIDTSTKGLKEITDDILRFINFYSL
ncbi:shikimate kinase [Dehalobacter sp. DCM]|uniref:shikimate kinase n=1 Tax=Dehalobacter sp. DCM TaxID=2907827 RepID=UPI0030818762|nr:shikimate kinase [Dehalobacter sp. DCM]